MAKLYRCENCGKTFEADRPVCVPCNIDPKDNPRFASIITPLTIVHFDPPTHVPNIGKNVCACDGKPFRGRMASGEPSAVNCKACRATLCWAKAWEASGGEPELLASEDEEVSLKGGTVTTEKAPGACC